MKAKRIKTKYWKPGANYLEQIVHSVREIVRDRDVLVISEKAISTALGQIVDESKIVPRSLAKFLAKYWMRFVWGCFLCEICHIKESTAVRLRNYPLHEGAKHKQLAIDKVGVLQALRFGSEGGIDVSNLPYSYACLPLTDPVKEAEKIHQAISRETGKSTVIVIADSDKTYSIGNLHVSPTKTAVPNIKCGGGVLTYIFGRGLKLKPSSTPKAIFPPRSLTTVEALKVAELAHRARGCGAGRTAWDMAEKFKVGLTKVTWEMLDSLEHYPIVVVRR